MPSLPRRLRVASSPAIFGLLILVSLVAGPWGARSSEADPSRVIANTTHFGQLPEQSGSTWSRVGDAPALVLSGDRLFLNDNTSTGRIAYQALLGEVVSTDRVTLLARVQILSNFDGDGALLEISRPGLEVVLRLRTGRVDLMERVGREMRWLGSADVDLTVPHEMRLTKDAAASDGGGEWASVAIDGVEVLRVLPRGGGTLAVGRVLMGSLSYPGFGASVWDWVNIELEGLGAGTRVRTESTSVGSLKSRWASPR